MARKRLEIEARRSLARGAHRRRASAASGSVYLRRQRMKLLASREVRGSRRVFIGASLSTTNVMSRFGGIASSLLQNGQALQRRAFLT